MDKVKFTPTQQMIMSAIEKKGEFLWDQSPFSDKKVKSALKDLMWMDLITRKPTYGNVFIATGLGKGAIGWNKTADLLNEATNGK